VYFNRPTASGSIDIYRVAVSHDGDALGPAVLVPELSDPTTFDQKVAVSADGHELLLSSFRAGGFGNFDIWRFTRQSAQEPLVESDTFGRADQHSGRRFATGALARRPHPDLHIDPARRLWHAGSLDVDAPARVQP